MGTQGIDPDDLLELQQVLAKKMSKQREGPFATGLTFNDVVAQASWKVRSNMGIGSTIKVLAKRMLKHCRLNGVPLSTVNPRVTVPICSLLRPFQKLAGQLPCTIPTSIAQGS